MIQKIPFTIALFALFIFFNSGTTAKDFESRIALNERSKSEGLARESIDLLRRLPGPGRDVVMEKLMKRFDQEKGAISTHGKAKQVEERGSRKLLGDGWRAKAWGGGSKFSYFNQKHTRQRQYKSVPLEERFTNAELEKMARNFIEEYLGDVIGLGPHEELVPLFTEFEISGGVGADGRMEEEVDMSSIIQLGRRIDGVHIVGTGSQIAIYFGNDGIPFGFDVDWPKYERTGVLQKTVSVDEIFKRLSMFSVKGRSADKMDIRRFECGYFDAGESNYDPYSSIQAGCVAHTVSTRYDKEIGSRIIAPILYDVPAGVHVIWDDNWPEAKMLKLTTDYCADGKLDECNCMASEAEQGQHEIQENLVGGGV